MVVTRGLFEEGPRGSAGGYLGLRLLGWVGGGRGEGLLGLGLGERPGSWMRLWL